MKTRNVHISNKKVCIFQNCVVLAEMRCADLLKMNTEL